MKHCHKLMVSEHLFHINANKTDNGHCCAIKTNTFQKINDFILFCSHFAVSLQKICCIREIKSKLSFLSFAISLQKISCIREIKNKFSFRSFAISLQKICCIREIKSKFSFRSFAVSLQKTRCVLAVSDTVNIRSYVLSVHTSYIGYAEDNILSGI